MAIRLSSDKHSILLYTFKSYEENQVLWKRPQGFRFKKQSGIIWKTKRRKCSDFGSKNIYLKALIIHWPRTLCPDYDLVGY